MADPATMTMMAAMASAAGKTVSAVGTYQQSRYNAGLMQAAAKSEAQAATVEAENSTREAQKTTGAARARAGGSGFSLSGSASDVIAQIAAEGYQKARTSAFDGLIRSRNYKERARAEKKRGKAALVEGLFGSGATVLTGLSKYSKAKADGETEALS